MHKKFQPENIDPMILAFASLIQPCTALEAYNLGRNEFSEIGISQEVFTDRFTALEHARYMWRTEDNGYILTEKGLRISERSLPKKKRDKLRVFSLKDLRNK